MTIAFLGTGNMGAGMAHCLLKAGHSLRAWNRTPGKTATLEAAGAVACASVAEAIDDADLAITSLMDDASIRALCEGPEGLFAKMKPGSIHLCTMTISPGCADWMAERHALRGTRYVSGPVVGRPDAAAAGKLLQFYAGDAGAIEEVKPVCHAFAELQLTLEGPASVANSQKLCVNFFIASLIETMSECLTFAEKAGASREIMAQFFDRSLALPGLKGYARRLAGRDSHGAEGFSMRGGLKDVSLMLDAARRVECPLDLAGVIESRMRECIAGGLADADWSAIQEANRARAGLPNLLKGA